MFLKSVVNVTSVLVAIAQASGAEVGYYSQPALWSDRLVFVSEGDLWSASIPDASPNASQPIIANRLTSSDGNEGRPRISPDGKWLAFTGQYDGNVDVFVMPIDGGAPKRLTFHPGPDLALGWLPDGQNVLFASPRSQPLGRPELWRVSVGGAGGSPVRYQFGECSMAAASSTGKRIAFTRWSNENWTWKRYRGGTAPEVWIGDFAAANFTKLTDNTASDLFPMWVQDRVFFLSDRTNTANIFSDSPDAPGKDLKQHTKFAPNVTDPKAIEGYDIRWPSADSKPAASKIIFCQAGGLAVLDAVNDSVRRLDVRLASDRAEMRTHFSPLADTLTEFNLSPDGKTLLIGSRGEIMSLPVETGCGVAQQLTHTSNAREWGAQYLGEDQLVMISDATGEQQIAVGPADGSEAPSLVTQDREAWMFPPATSPDGRWIAFADKTLRLHLMDMKALDRRQVDQSEAGEITDYRFSPDSQWLAYTKPMPNRLGAVTLYSIRTGRTFAVSDGLYNDTEPRWDPAGKYLYFLSDRNLNPVMGTIDFEYVLINTTEAFVLPLAAETPPPFKDVAQAAEFDLEEWATAPESEKEGKAGKKPTERAEAEAVADDVAPPADPNAPVAAAAMKIDTDSIASRIYRLPIEPGTFTDLEALWGSITYLSNKQVGLLDDTWPNPPPPSASLHRYDFVEEEDKVIAEKVAAYTVNQKKDALAYPEVGDEGKITGFLVVNPAEAGSAAEGAGSGEKDKSIKQVDISDVKLRSDARVEWAQMLAEAWRLQRDFFWAPNYAGVNWPAMKQKYEALLPRIGSRMELNDLMGQLIGELGNSHTYVFGGEQEREIKPVPVGMLGADIEFDGKGYRISRIIPGQKWGLEKFTSPLEDAHLGVKEGNYIIAINGVPLNAALSIEDALQNTADKTVRLTIAADSTGANPRHIQVKTIRDEQPLRYAAWVEANRKYVEEKSGGTLGYVHIPDMGGEGLSMFSRYFYPQYVKQGMVVDIRDNGGGFVSQMIISRLARKVWAFMEPRHGTRERYPMKSLYGYTAVLIDQHAGSDGDIFPQSFRMLGLGPLIGTRTWGGVVGIRGDKPFIDMGLSTQPEFAWWEPKGGWSVENVGVSPDIDIDTTPSDRAAGKDPQLDKVIEVLMQKLKDQPMEMPKPPPWPVRVGEKK